MDWLDSSGESDRESRVSSWAGRGDGAIGGSNTRRVRGNASAQRYRAERSGGRIATPTRRGIATPRGLGRRAAGASGVARLLAALMTKGEVLGLQRQAATKARGDESKESNKNWVHRESPIISRSMETLRFQCGQSFQ